MSAIWDMSYTLGSKSQVMSSLMMMVVKMLMTVLVILQRLSDLKSSFSVIR